MVSHDTTRTCRVPQHLQRPRARFLNHQMLRSPIFRQKKTSKTWRSLENIRISVYHHASAPLHTWLWPPWRRSAAAVPGERLSDGIKKNDIWPARQVKNIGSRWHFPRKISGFGTLQAEIRRLNAIVGCLANQELRVSTSRW